MSKWSHRICERCWFDGAPVVVEQFVTYGASDAELFGVNEDGTYRQPVQSTDPDPAACCFCGGMTITGIYVRHDPDKTLCIGLHDTGVTNWSRVGIEERRNA